MTINSNWIASSYLEHIKSQTIHIKTFQDLEDLSKAMSVLIENKNNISNVLKSFEGAEWIESLTNSEESNSVIRSSIFQFLQCIPILPKIGSSLQESISINDQMFHILSVLISILRLRKIGMKTQLLLGLLASQRQLECSPVSRSLKTRITTNLLEMLDEMEISQKQAQIIINNFSLRSISSKNLTALEKKVIQKCIKADSSILENRETNKLLFVIQSIEISQENSVPQTLLKTIQVALREKKALDIKDCLQIMSKLEERNYFNNRELQKFADQIYVEIKKKIILPKQPFDRILSLMQLMHSRSFLFPRDLNYRRSNDNRFLPYVLCIFSQGKQFGGI